MIDQGELDRLQQHQLREHSPELQKMVCLLHNMRNITNKRKLTAEERLNSISGLQIQFDKLKTVTGLLSVAIPPQVAPEALPAAQPLKNNVLADKGITPEEEEQEEQYENELEDKDKSDQASALSRQMARVIW